MKRFVYTLIAFCALFASCSKDSLKNPLDYQLIDAVRSASKDRTLEHFILPESNDYTDIPQDPLNPITTEKVTLGQMLFFETGLALSPAHSLSEESYSCSSCHVPWAGFTPGRMQGIGDGGIGFGERGENRAMAQLYDESEIDAQGAHPLNLSNVAFVKNTSWNGQFGGNFNNEGTDHLWNEEELTEINHLGYYGLESQNIEGLELHRMVVNKEVTDKYGYTVYFNNAFPDIPNEERYSLETASLAISAYLRTLTTSKAPFQEWLKGDKEAMTDEQKRGALLFFGKANCSNCHNGKSLNNADQFYGLGVNDLYQAGGLLTDANDRRNKGRGGFTGQEEDLYKFKVPQLYNLKNMGFYFHGSSKTSLREVVEYFDKGEPENANIPSSQVSSLFKPLKLSEREKEDLLIFLRDGLYDPKVASDCMPTNVLSGNCFPNNDAFSRLDLGCD